MSEAMVCAPPAASVPPVGSACSSAPPTPASWCLHCRWCTRSLRASGRRCNRCVTCGSQGQEVCGCDQPFPTLKRNKEGVIEYSFDDSPPQTVTPLHIKGIFASITDEDGEVLAERLGVDACHPPTHWVTRQIPPRPPPGPATRLTASSTDDTTTLLHF